MRAIIFAAVSTQEQATDDHASIETQLDDSRAACERYGWDVVTEIAVKGHSRNYDFLHRLMADCPEYAQMIDLVESKTIDLIVCRSWDRLARTTALQQDVARLFDQNHVQVYALNSPQMPVDPAELDAQTRHTRRITRFVSGWSAEQENIERAARYRAGMRARIQRGLHSCGGYCPYGYERGESSEVPFQAVTPTVEEVQQAASYTAKKDAPIVAAAKNAEADRLVTLDRRHLVGVPEVAEGSGLKIILP